MRLTLSFSLALFILGGCAGSTGVSPSQNNSLSAVSPSSTTVAKGGIMQQTMDDWLKEEWNPMMATEPTEKTKTTTDGMVVTTKTEPTTMTVSAKTAEGKVVEKTTKATQITTTTKAPDGTITTKTEVVPLTEDNEPFTLQKYVDKWKDYLDKKEKMNEGMPKEPSHAEMISHLPAIGK